MGYGFKNGVDLIFMATMSKVIFNRELAVIVAAMKWCDENIGPSSYPNVSAAWSINEIVLDNLLRKTVSDTCFFFEQESDAVWFKAVWA